MTCFECGEETFSFDERLGERVCDSCGLVEITELFESTTCNISNGVIIRSIDKPYHLGTGKRDKNITAGLIQCNMILGGGGWLTQSIKNRVEECYYALFKARVINSTYSYEERAAALVFYVLRDNNIPVSLKEVCSEYTLVRRKVNRLSRLIARFFGNSSVYARDNSIAILNKIVDGYDNSEGDSDNFRESCFIVHAYFMPILEAANFTKSRAYYGAICHMADDLYNCRVGKATIAKLVGLQASSIRTQKKKILGLVGRNNINGVKGVNEI